MVTDKVIYEYIGEDSQAYKNGRFYKATYDETQDVYYWQEVKFSADYDAQVLEGSTNAPQGGAVYTALQDKENKTLDTAIAIEGTTETTVEGALGGLNTRKAGLFEYSTMPQNPTVGQIVMYIGTTTANYKKGSWYEYQEVTPITDPPTYHWVEISGNINIDNMLNPSSQNPVSNSGLTNVIQALQGNVVLMYASESNLLAEIDYSAGLIVTLNTVAYCVAEKTWHKVTAIDSSTLAVTWSAYNPHLMGDFNSMDFDVDSTTDEVSLLPSRRIFTGSHLEWNALTLTQKAQYAFVAFNDDSTSGQGDTRKQDKLLSTPITIEGEQYSTVETALNKLAEFVNNSSFIMHTEG
jgi:hypothetical protein